MNSALQIVDGLCPAAAVNVRAALAAAIDAAPELAPPLVRAHFLAQALYESAHLTHLVENLNYTAANIRRVFPKLMNRALELAHRQAALANAAYANRYGNGDERSGDGFRYRGRGPLQHTFRDGYREVGGWLGLGLEEEPDLLLKADVGARAAIAYFVGRGCVGPAERDDVAEVTRRVNGGLNGLAPRAALEDEIEVKEGLKARLHRMTGAT